MEKEITRRGFLKGLAGLAIAGTVGIIPGVAEACGKSTFWDVLKPVLRNSEIEKTDEDEVVYINWDGDLKKLNEVSLNPGEYFGRLKSSTGLETVYNTSGEASRHTNRDTRYIVGINVKKGLGYGNIRDVFQLPMLRKDELSASGKWLEGHPFYRCIGSPLRFEENSERRTR